ncbi:MAG: molecular chaperone TorD family protein, partial [Rhodospirillales bacterium]|nr:molecular chaperone TorD family protein [Rhodospirillales bacterium]
MSGNKTESLDNLARTAEGGANLLGFLAGVFRAEISAELLSTIKQPEFLAALAEAGGDFEESLAGKPEGELLEELAIEFTSLFTGPGGHFSAHESVQIEGGSGTLWG